MIRDPSDGSVKEITHEANNINAVAPKTASKEIGPDTGIRQPVRTDAQERLERSREWLKNYHHRKEVNNARGDHGEELQTAGHSGGERDEDPRSPVE